MSLFPHNKLTPDPYDYLHGFDNDHQSEAIPHTLPTRGNTPQQVSHNLYAEQLSGTSFTTPRALNKRSWLYRIKPTCAHIPFRPVGEKSRLVSASLLTQFDSSTTSVTPNQLRWKPLPFPADNEKLDFLQGLYTVAGAGSVDLKTGLAIHLYSCNSSMTDKAYINADGDYLIVPQVGSLTVQTEFGVLHVQPMQIVVVPRGMAFSIIVHNDGDLNGKHIGSGSRGYVLEVYNNHFQLPELGVIGANGLANVKDFQIPVAAYEDNIYNEYDGDNYSGGMTVVQKFCGEWFYTVRDSSVFDVVAWSGNYTPYKYDLTKFCPVNAVLYDHMDPSIFTVLTCPSAEPGVAVADFVIFPPRYAVQEDTFRPPYYHRNCMSEYMGNIVGEYEAKPDGFQPGGGSLHSCMTGHGPDSTTFEKASTAELKPVRMTDQSMSFMFESTYFLRTSKWAMQAERYDPLYYKCWQPLQRNFRAPSAVKHANGVNGK